MIAQIVFGVGIENDQEVYRDGFVTVVPIQQMVIQNLDSMKIIAIRLKKIPAKYVEPVGSDIFIAEKNVTTYAELFNAFWADKACYAKVNGKKVPIIESHEEWSKGVLVEDDGHYIAVEISSITGDWTITDEYVLPRTSMVDHGKFLRVDMNGNWAIEAVPSAEGGSF